MPDSDPSHASGDEGAVAVAFRTLGCKVNRVESDDIAADLLGRGARIVSENEAAVVVINTCTVTGEADAKARKAVRHALSAPHAPVVVVTGCLAALDAAALRALGERVVVEADKSAVAQRVANLLALGDASLAHPHAAREGGDFRTRAMLKIEDGCDNFCSYCIVPHARGVPRSVPLADVVAHAETLVADGALEIVLTGINIGRYRDGAADLSAVIERAAATGVQRLRLSSVEPPDVTERLLTTLAEIPAACAHLHVPLQSGSDRVLAAMGRHYTVADYAQRIAAAREALPGLAVTTDAIVGFPGETDADFADTIELCRRTGFSKLHVFRYSARPGTPAAAMADQVPPATRAARAEALRAVGDELRAAYVDGRLGQSADVLVERVTDGQAEGTTRDYLRVRFSAGDVRAGEIVAVPLVDAR